MNNLSKYVFQNNQVRLISLDNEIWFVAKDIATILDYADVRRMVDLVDKEDTKVVNPHKIDSAIFAETFNINTFRVSLINESGLYACIFGSHKPNAKEFKRWVTSKVLPSIRKTGKYEVAKEVELPTTYLEALKALVASEEAKLALEAKIETDKPKVDFADAVAFSDNSLEFNEYAKIIGWGRNKLMAKLRELNILMLNSTLPYQKWIDADYFECSQELIGTGKTVPFALVTGKGQLWLKQRLDKAMREEKQSSLTFPPKDNHKKLKIC